MYDAKTNIQLIMDSVEARVSNHLSSNWKEKLDKILKQVVQNRSLGDERQHKLQNEIKDLMRGVQTDLNSKDSSQRNSPIFNPLCRR